LSARAHFLRGSALLVASNWEKLGADAAGFSFANDSSGNLVITVLGGTVFNSGLFLKTSVIPVRQNGSYFCRLQYQTWGTGTDQTRAGIGIRANADTDFQAMITGRNTGNDMQVRGVEVLNGVNSVLGTNTNLGNQVPDIFHDLALAAAGTSLSGTAVRTATADTPTAWSATVTALPAGQVGIAWRGLVTGAVLTVSDFSVVS
jgi:hypothetical protein